jgi:hypothetical protein
MNASFKPRFDMLEDRLVPATFLATAEPTPPPPGVEPAESLVGHADGGTAAGTVHIVCRDHLVIGTRPK